MIRNSRLSSVHPQQLRMIQEVHNINIADNASELSNSPINDYNLSRKSSEPLNSALFSHAEIPYGQFGPERRLFNFCENTRASSLLSGQKDSFSLSPADFSSSAQKMLSPETASPQPLAIQTKECLHVEDMTNYCESNKNLIHKGPQMMRHDLHDPQENKQLKHP